MRPSLKRRITDDQLMAPAMNLKHGSSLSSAPLPATMATINPHTWTRRSERQLENIKWWRGFADQCGIPTTIRLPRVGTTNEWQCSVVKSCEEEFAIDNRIHAAADLEQTLHFRYRARLHNTSALSDGIRRLGKAMQKKPQRWGFIMLDFQMSASEAMTAYSDVDAAFDAHVQAGVSVGRVLGSFPRFVRFVSIAEGWTCTTHLDVNGEIHRRSRREDDDGFENTDHARCWRFFNDVFIWAVFTTLGIVRARMTSVIPIGIGVPNYRSYWTLPISMIRFLGEYRFSMNMDSFISDYERNTLNDNEDSRHLSSSSTSTTTRAVTEWNNFAKWQRRYILDGSSIVVMVDDDTSYPLHTAQAAFQSDLSRIRIQSQCLQNLTSILSMVVVPSTITVLQLDIQPLLRPSDAITTSSFIEQLNFVLPLLTELRKFSMSVYEGRCGTVIDMSSIVLGLSTYCTALDSVALTRLGTTTGIRIDRHSLETLLFSMNLTMLNASGIHKDDEKHLNYIGSHLADYSPLTDRRFLLLALNYHVSHAFQHYLAVSDNTWIVMPLDDLREDELELFKSSQQRPEEFLAKWAPWLQMQDPHRPKTQISIWMIHSKRLIAKRRARAWSRIALWIAWMRAQGESKIRLSLRPLLKSIMSSAFDVVRTPRFRLH